MPTRCHKEIIRQAQRLGAQFAPPDLAEDEKSIEGHLIPEPMLAFLFGLTWPQNVRYASAEDSALWVWRVDLNIFDWVDPDEFPIADRGERPLVCFGEADGGNYMLILDLDDPNPADPQVYKLDHDEPEQTLRPRMKLSEFLALLEKEDE